MKDKTLFLAGAGVIIGAMAFKASFDFGAKIGIVSLLSDLPTEDISKIVPKEKGGWYKDISKLIAINKEMKTK